MKTIRVAGAPLNQIPLDWEGNFARTSNALAEARRLGAELVCFPELSLSGYNCEDMFLHPHTYEAAAATLKKLLPLTENLVAAFGLPVYWQGALYNCMAVVQNGRLLGLHPKKLLPREGVHYEGRWFSPAPAKLFSHHDFFGEIVPFGNYRYNFGGFSFAIELCEESWTSERGAASQADHGVELVLNPSASHFALGKYKVREQIAINNSRAMGTHYLHVNLLGLEAGRAIYDGAVMFAENGSITKRGQLFSFKDHLVIASDLDLDKVRAARLRSRSERQFEDDPYLNQVITGSPFIAETKPDLPVSRKLHNEAVEGQTPLSLEEEFLAAETLGLFDYLRKAGAKGYVVSLSGGCDSACASLLVAQMITMALKELGEEVFAKALGIPLEKTAAAWTRQLLTLVYQGTKYSSVTTREAAAGLAKALGADFHSVEVQELVDGYTSAAEKIFGRVLNWQTDDTALQNIQARARAPMIWLVANLKNALLISTSNQSEAAVGYATMDGDTAGGIAPLAGVGKPFLRQWLRWAAKDCQWGLGPVAALASINSLAPTAELKPATYAQTDETDLMPYPILDRIQNLFLLDRKSPPEILTTLGKEFPQDGREDHILYIERFFQLWRQNQWKRERYAPSFHMAPASLDPKTWCRFPILSRLFQEEVRILKKEK